jgi:signal transduction histidine kinase
MTTVRDTPEPVAPVDGAVAPTATDRIRRALFLVTGIVGVVFSALGFSRTMTQSSILEPTWFALTTTALWALPVVLVVTAAWAPMRWVRAIAISYVVAYCFTLLTWLPLMQVDHTDGTAPWITYVLSVPVFCAVSLWSERTAWAWLVGLCVAIGVLRFLAEGATNPSEPLQGILYNSMSLTIFAAVMMVVVRGGRQRDRIAHTAAIEAAHAAAAEARRVQRARVAALTHDDVLMALRTAAEATPETGDAVREHARRTLQRLDSLALEDNTPLEWMTAPEFIVTLRAAVSAAAADIRFDAPRYAMGDVPREVAQALVDATVEGVHNSVRHAVPQPGSSVVARSVRVVMSGQAVSVVVADDGAGFDPARDAVDHRGIRLGIRERLAKVPGAHGNVDSSPATGTRVALSWVQPAGGTR